MNRTTTAARAAFVFAAAGTLACQGGGLDSAQNAPLDTQDQQASYAIGIQMGNSLAPAADRIQLDAFLRGIQDALAERDPAIAQAEMQTVLQTFTQEIQQEQEAERTATGETNRQAGEAYLAENAQKEGVTVTASGLQYEVMRAGDGPRPQPDDRVRIHYRGTLIDGTEFDSSYARGEPIAFGVTGVIPGFSEGLQLMPVGSQYRFVIPGDLAYGPNGSGQLIGPNATLIFEVELLEIVE